MRFYQNILVYSFANLGDVLLSTAAVALLKKVYPQAKITMMVKPAAAGLLTNNPLIDEALVYDKKKIRTLREHICFINGLKTHGFDLAISMDGKLRSTLLIWLANIPTRVGPDRLFDNKTSLVTKLYTHIVQMPVDIVNRLQVENYQDIVRQFTGVAQSARPVMAAPTVGEEESARRLIHGLPATHYRIALCVKGTFPLKDWPPDHFAAVIDALASRFNATFFITGAPGDYAYAEQVIALAKTPVANFCGKTNLGELVYLLKQSNLFITVDTGAAHIGATTGVPMVVIYGCTSPKRWRPVSDTVKVISRELNCCPCAYPADGCPNGIKCLGGITVGEVITAADNLFKVE